MPAVKLSPLFNGQTVTSTGAPASGYKLYTYAAGSSAPLPTYTDSNGTTPQANPIDLNSSGYPANPIWLQSGRSYKFILKDGDDNLIRTVDNISGVNDTGAAVSQWQASGLTPTYISASSFSLQGDQTTAFHTGRRLQFTTTVGTAYGVILTATYAASITTVSMLMDVGQALDSGLSAVNLSILTASSPSLPSVSKARVTGYPTAAQVVAAANTWTQIQFNAEVFDRMNEYDTATYTFTAKEAGDYLIGVIVQWSLGVSGDWGEVAIHKNGSRVKTWRASTADSTQARACPGGSHVFNLAVGDTIKFYGQHNSSTAGRSIVTSGDSELSSFFITKL